MVKVGRWAALVFAVMIWDTFCFGVIFMGMVMPTKERKMKMRDVLIEVLEAFLMIVRGNIPLIPIPILATFPPTIYMAAVWPQLPFSFTAPLILALSILTSISLYIALPFTGWPLRQFIPLRPDTKREPAAQ